MDETENLTAMLLFARVVETQSFSEAARTLGLSKSHVSREIARLEVRLGIRLLQRTTRRLALTELGHAYYHFCTRVRDEMTQASDFVRQVHQQPAGNVRLIAPVTFGCQCVVPALNGFIAAHVHINVDLELTDRAVEVDQDNFDIAIVVRQRAPESGYFRLLSEIEWGLYAAPAYLLNRSPVSHPTMLARHDLLLFHGAAQTASLAFRREKQRITIAARSRFRANNSMALLNAALAGNGIAWLPSYMTREALQQGRIERVLPEWRLDRFQSYLLLKHPQMPSSPVSLLCDSLVMALSQA
ncbi:LysR family transcriptional regulator [Paramixta manurensis]|uniref:LysR family transcriptional regulator n=1 Tax=Paramixta manurensis TaxID=2740817 RepID=A0A6M8UE30_9GAMM|nr:LysR family transcriptional regulator [Erwiniaceae bacterium PD-1]